MTCPCMLGRRSQRDRIYYVFRRWSTRGGTLDAFSCSGDEDSCKDQLPADLLSLVPGRRGAYATVNASNRKAAITAARSRLGL